MLYGYVLEDLFIFKAERLGVASSLKFQPGLPCGWQGSKYLSCCSLPSWLCWQGPGLEVVQLGLKLELPYGILALQMAT